MSDFLLKYSAAELKCCGAIDVIRKVPVTG